MCLFAHVCMHPVQFKLVLTVFAKRTSVLNDDSFVVSTCGFPRTRSARPDISLLCFPLLACFLRP